MRTVFLHGDSGELTSALEALNEKFEAWCAARGAAPAPGLVGVTAQERICADGLLAGWTVDALRTFLLESCPRRVLLDEDDWPRVPEFLHSWVDFLAESDLLMSEGASPEELHEVIEAERERFFAAMRDPREFSATKFWHLLMVEHGVDPADEYDVEEFFDAVDHGEIEVDAATADLVEDRSEREAPLEPAVWLPAVEVFDDESLAVLAEGTDVVRWMRALRDRLGDGLDLDGSGVPGDAEVAEIAALFGPADRQVLTRSEVEFLLEWARKARLVRVVRGRMLPVKSMAPRCGRSLELWLHLWEVFAGMDRRLSGELRAAGADGDVLADPLAFPDLLGRVLHALTTSSEALPRELLADVAVDAGEDESAASPAGPVSGKVREAFGTAVRLVLERWELMGAVRQYVSTDPEVTADIDELVPSGDVPDYTMVELMPLGVRGACEFLRAAGFVVPTLEEMAARPAEVLAVSLAGSAQQDAAEVAGCWIDARGPQQASAELAALLRRVDDPLIRVTALWALEHTGRHGVEAVRGLRQDPVAGPMARVWLAGQGESGDERLSREDEISALLDSISIAIGDDPEGFVEEFAQQPTTRQIALVEEIPRARHNRGGTVLEAVARNHPDKRVAKVARRSLHRLRDS